MSYKLSVTAERYDNVRPLDLQRRWHDKLEVWVLKEACIDFMPVQIRQDLHATASI